MKKLGIAVGRIAFWAGWPVLHVLLKCSTRTRVLVVSGSRALAVRSYLGAGDWGMPGGGLKRGEMAAAAAARELAEETGVVCDPQDFIAFGTGTENHHGHPYRAVYFAVVLTAKPALRRQTTEISDLAWQPLDEVLATVTDQTVRRQLREWASTAA